MVCGCQFEKQWQQHKAKMKLKENVARAVDIYTSQLY